MESNSEIFYDEKEQALIQKTKRLVLENEAFKRRLVKQNETIERFCFELECVKRHQLRDKDENKKFISSLQERIAYYEGREADDYLYVGDNMERKSLPYHECIEKIFEKIGASLKYPIQESQLEELKHSLMNVECKSTSIVEQQPSQKILQIQELKSKLTEHMENTEQLGHVQKQLEDARKQNLELETERDKFKKKIIQLQQRIEQLEFEPSVEVMQVASPMQAKTIEVLNKDLEETKEKMATLLEENECLKLKITSLNEVCLKASSMQLQDPDKDTIATIASLKKEIESEKKRREEAGKALSEMTDALEEERQKKSKEQEEAASLKRTIEILRKRESKDMDKLNKVTSERDNYKRDCEEKILIIQNLREKQDGEGQPSSQNLTIQKAETNDFHSTELTARFEDLKRQLSSTEEQLGIISEQKTNLERELKEKDVGCRCSELEKQIEELLEEKKRLLTMKVGSEELLQRHYYEEKSKNEELEALADDLQEKMILMQKEFKQKQINDGMMIQHLNEELKRFEEHRTASRKEISEYRTALEDARQKNEVMEASLTKSKNDFSKLWKNFQTKMTLINELEARKKELDEMFSSSHMKQSKLESLLETSYSENLKLQKSLDTKEREMKSLGEEIQTMEILQEQVKVYETDFKMEREAREKQHGDILILREKVHHLKLENNRLREDVEAVQRHKVQDLKRRFGNASVPVTQQGYYNMPSSGIYGRGAPVSGTRPDYQAADDYGRGSIEVAPQDSDQGMQRACPKCHMTFPDLDTLQIHIFECVE